MRMNLLGVSKDIIFLLALLQSIINLLNSRFLVMKIMGLEKLILHHKVINIL